MRNDPLADVLNNMLTAEKIGKSTAQSKPYNKIIGRVLEIMKDRSYITSFEVLDDKKGGIVTVNLKGSINKCGVVKPRFSVQKDNFEKFEERFLPAKDFGVLIVSTPKGIMTHHEAKEQAIGGKLLGYCY